MKSNFEVSRQLLVVGLIVMDSLIVSPIAQAQTPAEPKPNDTSVPPAMTKEQIMSLLEEKKHIVDEPGIADVQSWLGHWKKNVPPKEYPLIVQQVTAIESAGQSKDKFFIPYLIDYFDYVSLHSAMISSPFIANPLSLRRERNPALDALMKINSAEGLSSYIEGDHPLKKRVDALSVLREIDYDKAVELGTKLLDDPDAKKDDNLSQWIKDLMQKEIPSRKVTPSVPATPPGK